MIRRKKKPYQQFNFIVIIRIFTTTVSQYLVTGTCIILEIHIHQEGSITLYLSVSYKNDFILRQKIDPNKL